MEGFFVSRIGESPVRARLSGAYANRKEFFESGHTAMFALIVADPGELVFRR